MCIYDVRGASLVTQLVKNPPAMLETQVRFLGREDPLRDRLATLSSASLVAQMVKNPPAKQETRVGSLGQEDPLQEGMAIPSIILAWRIPWTEKPGELQPIRSQSWTQLKQLSMHAK